MSTIYQSDEWRALLRGICEVPDADLPRLVAADWLDEHDEGDRAEFIRNWIAQPTRTALLMPNHLIRHNDTVMFTGYPRLWPSGKLEVSRGFVGKIILTLDNFEDYAAELFTFHPITSVVLSGREPYVTTVQNEYFYYWSSPGWGALNDVLPQCVYDILPDLGFSSVSQSMKGFRSRELALKALSDACVAVGRERAKLPTLSRSIV